MKPEYGCCKRLSRISLGLMLLACSLFSSLSWAVRVPLADYFVEGWTTKDGLPHNSINTMAQTAEGYLWFGTWEGVARYNGREFKLYERSPQTGLLDSGIQSLQAQADGSLLLAGARGSLVSVTGDRWQPYAPAATMINAVWKDRLGNLWLAMEGKGVVVRSMGRDGQYNDSQPILSQLSAYRFAEDAQGRVWIATDRGLYVVEQQKPRHVPLPGALPAPRIFTLAQQANGALLLGTEKGLWRQEGDTFKPLEPALADAAVTSLLLDGQQDLWIGTMNHGIYRLSPTGLERLETETGLLKNRVLSLLQDQEQNIWIGTNAGLFRLRAAPFTTLTSRQGLSGDYVRAVLAHSDGSVWVGTSTGLSRWQHGQLTPIPSPDGDAPVSVLSLAEAADGSVWVGTYTNGLLHWQHNHLTPVRDQRSGLSSNEIRALLVDQHRNLWLGTAAGLDRLSADGQIRHYTAADGLPADFVISLYQDARQRIWVGTGVGVAILEQDRFTTIPIHQQEGAEYVFGFYGEPNGMWMATDRGLVHYRLADGHLSVVGRAAGLPVDKLFQVVPDRQGAFWLTSNRGMFRIQQQDARAITEGRARRLHVEVFGESDGLVSAQANGGSNPAATLLRSDGSVWMATARGVARVRPERINDAGETLLPIVIEAMDVDGRSLALRPNLELPAGTSRIRIRYAGLGYVIPSRILYRTQLTGFDPHWIERNHEASAEYTNLPPGSYQFRVMASYPHGKWQGQQASLRFTIQPFFWQRIEFQLLMLLGGGLVLWLVVQFRLHTLRRNEARLTRLVTEKTTALQEQATAFERQAREDQLTGLANRRAFDEQLLTAFNRAKEQQTPLAMAIVDIDHFKQINDRWSHVIGDQAICAVARTLQHAMPDSGLLARWGGEEFTLIFPGLDARQAHACCERMRQRIAEADYTPIATGLHLTASFGVCDTHAITHYQELLRLADQALYQAKAHGRNRVVCWQETPLG